MTRTKPKQVNPLKLKAFELMKLRGASRTEIQSELKMPERTYFRYQRVYLNSPFAAKPRYLTQAPHA